MPTMLYVSGLNLRALPVIATLIIAVASRLRHLLVCWRFSFLFVTAIFLLCLGQPVQAQAQSSYWFALNQADHAVSGFVLVNTRSTAVNVMLTARSYGGALILGDQINNPATLT